MIINVLVYLICFSIFVVLQSLTINGIHECFNGKKFVDGLSKKVEYTGEVLYMLAPEFFEKYKYRAWAKPLYRCVKCMSSVWGAVTFWPLVIFLFGFHFIELLVFVFDVFILVYLNFFFFKRV